MLPEILMLPVEERAKLALELLRSLDGEIPCARAYASSRPPAHVNLRIHRSAVAEIDHEVDDYESRQSGLGAVLEDEIDRVPSFIDG